MIVGAGSAGCGIAEQIVLQMRDQGLSEAEARARIWMVDKHGLVTETMHELYEFQRRLAKPAAAYDYWNIDTDTATLADVVEYVQPHILIGVSGQPGLFSEALIKSMLRSCDNPIIFPLSNPSRQVEATPIQLLQWTDGKALIATGSPFGNVSYQGKDYPIAQCNNSYIFPGIGLAVVAAGIDFITDQMLVVASEVLAQSSPLAQAGAGPLLPPLNHIGEVSKKIAYAVAKQAQQQGLARTVTDATLKQVIEDNFWLPEYRQYRRVSM